jgi:hypothetical protein
MLFLTRCFGVTGSDAERDPSGEQAVIDEITEKVLVLQAKSAAQQNRPLGRGTHPKGICARAEFEVLDVTVGRDSAMASRLAKGIFAKPDVYPAVVRFGNADPKVNSDFKPDVRSLSFSVDLTRGGSFPSSTGVDRQDFSLQNAPPLPINDSRAFLAVMKVLTASNPGIGLLSIPLKDKLRALRAIALAQIQSRQAIEPYQKLRYWSNVPFRHGDLDTVQFSAMPSTTNAARPLDKDNPKALQDELIRHLTQDQTMSTFNFGVQLLDPSKMTYWGKRYDANFWIENASVVWNEAEAPFHTVARLTLVPNSQLSQTESHTTYFDVTGHSTPDNRPVGSINRARWRAEAASKEARLAKSRVHSSELPAEPVGGSGAV